MSEEVEDLVITLRGNVGPYLGALRQADSANDKAVRSASRAQRAAHDIGEAHSRAARAIKASSLVQLASGTAIVAGLKSAVTSAASFETTLRQVAVATGEPAKGIQSLSDLALKMGKDTVFSAQEAGGAMLELAKSGLDSAQIKAGALQSTLTLASAGSLELAESAGYVTSGLALFNLEASKSGDVAAALAGAANASKASVQDIGLALSQVGPGAQNAGLSLQETTGVLALFAKNGILGSDAGTSLKTMLARLTPQTDKAAGMMRKLGLDFTDAEGNFISIDEVAGQLNKSLMGLSDAERTNALNVLFGSDASRAALILAKEGAKGVREMTKATSDKTQADKLAAAATEGTAGALSRMSGAIDTAKLQLGTALSPLVVELADDVSTLADRFGSDGVPKIQLFIKGLQDGTGTGGEFRDAVEAVGTALQTAWSVGSPILSFIGDHPKLFTQIAIDAAELAVALKGVSAVRNLGGLLNIGKGGGALGGLTGGLGVQHVWVDNLGPGGFGVPGTGGSGGSSAPVAALGPVTVGAVAGDALWRWTMSKTHGHRTDDQNEFWHDLTGKLTDSSNLPGTDAKTGSHYFRDRRDAQLEVIAGGGFDPMAAYQYLEKYGKRNQEVFDAMQRLAQDPSVASYAAAVANAQKQATDQLLQDVRRAELGLGQIAPAARQAGDEVLHGLGGALKSARTDAQGLAAELRNMPTQGTYTQRLVLQGGQLSGLLPGGGLVGAVRDSDYTVRVPVHIDGRQVAEVVAPHINRNNRRNNTSSISPRNRTAS